MNYFLKGNFSVRDLALDNELKVKSHSFFSVTIVFGRIFVVLLYLRKKIYKFIERKLDWKKVGSFGWS